MTKLKKILAVGLAATTLAIAFAPSAEARWRRGYHRGGGWGPGIAAGVVGGALLGAALAPRPVYGAPVYADPYYAAPVYAAPQVQCQREFTGYYSRSGRPRYNKVCYQY